MVLREEVLLCRLLREHEEHEDRAQHAKGPRHTYALDDYGLDHEAVDRALGSYIRQYNVHLER